MIEYVRWGASSVGELFKTPGLSDEQFIQHCLNLCADAGAAQCTGFSDTVCGAADTRCCKFYAAPAVADTFFLPGDATYVRSTPSAAGATAAPASIDGHAEGARVAVDVVINPWDDSYEGDSTAGNGTAVGGGGAYVGVRVETKQASLFDWRVILLTIGAFALGTAVGALTRRNAPPVPPPALPAHVGVPIHQAAWQKPKPPAGPPPPDVQLDHLARRASGSKGFGEFQHRMPSRGNSFGGSQHKVPSEREEPWLPVLVTDSQRQDSRQQTV